MFGFFFRLGSNADNTNSDFYPIFIAFAHGMLVLIGTLPLTQASDCSSPTSAGCFGQAWASPSSSPHSPWKCTS
jgi:hypothetical protein